MFHVTQDGPRRCTATTRSCPYANSLDMEQTHFENPAEAQVAYAKMMEKRFENHGVLARKIVKMYVGHKNNTAKQRAYRMGYKLTHNKVVYTVREIKDVVNVISAHRRKAKMLHVPSRTEQKVMELRQAARALSTRNTKRALVVGARAFNKAQQEATKKKRDTAVWFMNAVYGPPAKPRRAIIE